LKEVAPFGHPDADPKLIGRGINVMLSPLPRNKRARNPNQLQGNGTPPAEDRVEHLQPVLAATEKPSHSVPTNAAEQAKSFGHSPFAHIDLPVGQ
jgi:hypothetical protein